MIRNTARNPTPRPMTAKRLENIAIHYCQRYVVSAPKLADYLERRLFRDMRDTENRADMAREIPAIVARLAVQGLVNDREAAAAKLRGTLRSGYATDRAVTIAARAAMVDRETVTAERDAALAQALPELDAADGDGPPAAAQAALALKRARRGPWRGAAQDERTRRRDAAWLQRRGFRLETVLAALDIDPGEIG